MYAIVPAVNGVPDIGSRHLYRGISISPSSALAHFEGDIKDEWQELAEEEYLEKVEEITGAYPTDPSPLPKHETIEQTIEQKLKCIENQNLLIMGALVDLLAEYPLPGGRKTEADIYTELIAAGQRNIEDIPETLKEAVGKRVEERTGKQIGIKEEPDAKGAMPL